MIPSTFIGRNWSISCRWLSNRSRWPRSSPTSQPGYLMYDSVDDLKPPQDGPSPIRPQETPLQLLKRTVFGMTSSSKPVPKELLPDLRQPLTLHQAQSAIKYHQHQNDPSAKGIIQQTSTPRHHQLMDLLMHTVRQRVAEKVSVETEIIEDDFDDMIMQTLEPHPIQDHIECANVLKKRRAKMRRHKHKKRLKMNRYKSKK